MLSYSTLFFREIQNNVIFRINSPSCERITNMVQRQLHRPSNGMLLLMRYGSSISSLYTLLTWLKGESLHTASSLYKSLICCQINCALLPGAASLESQRAKQILEYDGEHPIKIVSSVIPSVLHYINKETGKFCYITFSQIFNTKFDCVNKKNTRHLWWK